MGGALDHGVAKLDRERQAIAFVRIEPRPFVAVLHFHTACDAQKFFRCSLLFEAGLLDQQHEGRCAAVHDRQLGRIKVHVRVVYTQAPERGHQVLDGVDLHFALDQRRSEARLPDELRPCRDIDRDGEVDATEHHAGVHWRGAQGDPDFLAGVQAYAGGADQGFERALPKH